MSYNKKHVLIAFLLLILVYGISYLMLKGTGAPRSFFHTIILVFFITLCSSSKKAFWYIVFPISCIYALYSPIGFTFGGLTYDFFIAATSTDILESSEFFHQIPYKYYLIPVLIVSGLIFYRKIIVNYDIHYFKNRSFLIVSILIMVSFLAPSHFIRQFKTSASNIYNEQQLLKNISKKQSWGESYLLNSKYDNYVLVIGESARRDYHHAYGYPINNTPFMSSSNGILINGLTGGGTSTVPSLKAMLTLSDKHSWDADYEKTIVGLAKSAAIKTYWLSNQGYLGTHDTPISAIADSVSQSTFLKYGSYDSINTSDYALLPLFQKIITESPTEKKLIIIHLYGSHPNPCERISDYHLIHEIQDSYYNYLNCYIASIHKTDDFLKEIDSLLTVNFEKNNSNFSLLYFSDHGLAHNEANNSLHFNNSKVSKYHYDIPLFMKSSDHTDRKECSSFKSGLNFTNGLANWMGIKNKFLNDNYSLFNCTNDPDDFGLIKKIKNNIDDPAIDLNTK